MRKVLLISFVAVCSLVGMAFTWQGGPTMQVVSDKAVVEFVFESKGVDGTFSDLTGSIVFDPNNLENANISGSVPVETITTGIGFRNWHLKREKYFNEEQYSRISYQSTRITETDDGYQMDGNITMKGSTQPLTFYFTYNNLVFEGNATLYSSDFDISISNEREKNKVSIRVLVPVM